MQALKFQAIAVRRKTADGAPTFIGDINISCEDTVQLLGADIDFMLNLSARKLYNKLIFLKELAETYVN